MREEIDETQRDSVFHPISKHRHRELLNKRGAVESFYIYLKVFWKTHEALSEKY